MFVYGQENLSASIRQWSPDALQVGAHLSAPTDNLTGRRRVIYVPANESHYFGSPDNLSDYWLAKHALKHATARTAGAGRIQ